MPGGEPVVRGDTGDFPVRSGRKVGAAGEVYSWDESALRRSSGGTSTNYQENLGYEAGLFTSLADVRSVRMVCRLVRCNLLRHPLGEGLCLAFVHHLGIGRLHQNMPSLLVSWH